MGRDQTGYPAILDDNEAAASGSQHILVNKILQAEMPLHRSVVAIHDVRDTPVPESCHEFDLNIAGTGCIQQEPTDKSQPQPAEVHARKNRIKPHKMNMKATAWPTWAASLVERSAFR